MVIVGTGELGPGGTGRSRFALELDERRLAGRRRRARVADRPRQLRARALPRPLDRQPRRKEEVREEDLHARYADAVAQRIGVRALEDRRHDRRATATPCSRPVTLEQPVTFTVDSEARGALVRRRESDATATASTSRSAARSASRASSRRPAASPASCPTGLDLARFGVPNDLIATADRMALVNLAATVEAFADAGLEPQELLDHVHPADVANTQGAGMGGMASLRRLLLDHLLDDERQNDRVQESLGNVVAAHAVQTYLGSYGPMIHPVGACATAAVSLEVAYDKIVAGKALAVLAGGFDDLTPEGMIGFADMGATASSDDLEAMGLAPHEARRANDIAARAASSKPRAAARSWSSAATSRSRSACRSAACSPTRARFADGLHTSHPGLRPRRARGRAAARAKRSPPRPDRRRHRRRLQARHLDGDERPQRGRPARPAPDRARSHPGQPAARRLAEDGHRPRQGRRRGVAARRRAADARDRPRPRQPQPGERRPAHARQPPPGARRPPDRARGAAAGRADRQPRLRPRVRDPRRRAPRHVPRGDRPGAARRLPARAPAAAAPRASAAGWRCALGKPPLVRRPRELDRDAEAALLLDR